MERNVITFSANEQVLTKTDGINCYASNTVSYIVAQFELGDNWDGFDSVRAVFSSDFATVPAVLAHDSCVVPFEVLRRRSTVRVNLVGSVVENDVLIDRLTTFPVEALRVTANATVDNNIAPISPSEFEQFVAMVKDDADRAEAGAESAEGFSESASSSAEAALLSAQASEASAVRSANSASDSADSATASANSASDAQGYAQNAQNSAQNAENAKDEAIDARDEILGMRAEATTLAEGSDATASYSAGVLTLGIPKGDKGEQGDQGIQGETGLTPQLSIGTVTTLPPTGQSSVTIRGTAENPILDFELVKGDTGEVSQAELDEAVTDLKSDILGDDITYADNDSDWQQGNFSTNSSEATAMLASTTRLTNTKRMAVKAGEEIHFDCSNNCKYRVLFFSVVGNINVNVSYGLVDAGLDDYRTWHTDSRILTVPSGAVGFGLSIAYTDDRTVTPSTRPNIEIWTQSLKGKVDEIEGKVNFLYPVDLGGKKISILGDSISTFAGAGAESAGDGHTIADGTYTYAGNHCRYPNSYLSNVSDTYWMKLINALGMELGVNDSWAGSRVSWSGSEGSDYGADIYIASPTRIGHLDDNGTPNYILVNAGTNDIGVSVSIGTFNTESPVNYTDEQIASLPVATFADAYRALLIRLQKAYPLARIVVMLPNYTTSYYNPTNADKYLEVIKEACDYFGVPWIDMRTTGITMYNTGTYTGDGIHPNISGMELLYEKVVKFFEYSL